MQDLSVRLVAVESAAQREAARVLLSEYLHWVAGIASSEYGLSFDVDAMVRSDIEDRSKFYPPAGRLYLVQHGASLVGVGALKRLAPSVGEVQRMYVQPHVRGLGAGRALVEQLLRDAAELGYTTVRLESLRALAAAHSLYRSVGFRQVDAYAENSMNAYQDPAMLARYRQSAVFMELSLQAGIEVEPAAPSDCHAVAEVHVGSWQQAYREVLPAAYLAALSVAQREAMWIRHLEQQPSHLLVARHAGHVVGFVAFGASRDEGVPAERGEIWALYVRPSAWSCGAGLALWLAAAKQLTSEGFTSVSLWVIAGNQRAIRFYARAGFEAELGSRKSFELGGVTLEEVRHVYRPAG